MPNFKLSALKSNNASVEWSYFSQKCIKFHVTRGHLDFKNFPGDKPRTPAYRGGEGKGEGLKGSFKGRDGGKGQGRGKMEGKG